MKCVLTREEAQHMLKMFTHPHFSNCRNYCVMAEVDPDWAKKVLPPGLEPADPVVCLTISKGDQFTGLVTGLQCRYKDMVGFYGLTYMMDTDLAVIFGREGLAEPKKLAVTSVTDNGKNFVGTVTRFGQELLRIEADIVAPGPEGLVTGPMDFFHYKYCIKVDGSGLEPIHLINSHFDNKGTDPAIMNVTKIQLNESAFDIFGDIPVTKVTGAFITTLDMIGSAKYLCEINEEDFLPYAFMKHDDYRLTMQVD